MFSIEGFKNTFNVLLNGEHMNIDAREKLALGSICGITALMNSGDGPTNGFAYYLGVKYNVPHGLAGAIFLKEKILIIGAGRTDAGVHALAQVAHVVLPDRLYAPQLCHALNGKILVHRTYVGTLGLGENQVVGGVGNRSSTRDGGDTATPSSFDSVVHTIAV